MNQNHSNCSLISQFKVQIVAELSYWGGGRQKKKGKSEENRITSTAFLRRRSSSGFHGGAEAIAAMEMEFEANLCSEFLEFKSFSVQFCYEMRI